MPPFLKPVRAPGNADNLRSSLDKRRRQMPPDARTGAGYTSHTPGHIETLDGHVPALLLIIR
jgi:hypothetical protein